MNRAETCLSSCWKTKWCSAHCPTPLSQRSVKKWTRWVLLQNVQQNALSSAAFPLVEEVFRSFTLSTHFTCHAQLALSDWVVNMYVLDGCSATWWRTEPKPHRRLCVFGVEWGVLCSMAPSICDQELQLYLRLSNIKVIFEQISNSKPEFSLLCHVTRRWCSHNYHTSNTMCTTCCRNSNYSQPTNTSVFLQHHLKNKVCNKKATC